MGLKHPATAGPPELPAQCVAHGGWAQGSRLIPAPLGSASRAQGTSRPELTGRECTLPSSLAGTWSGLLRSSRPLDSAVAALCVIGEVLLAPE